MMMQHRVYALDLAHNSQTDGRACGLRIGASKTAGCGDMPEPRR